MVAKYSKKAYILMGLGLLVLVCGFFTFNISELLFLILLGCGAFIFLSGSLIWAKGKFIEAGYNKKSSTARKRGAVAISLGLLMLVVGGIVNWAISASGWVWVGILLVGTVILLRGLYMLLAGRG